MTTPWQPGFQGVTVVPSTYTDPHNYSPVSALQLVATTGPAGFTLINGTPVILSWTAPADNQMHRLVLFAVKNVTSLETGGVVNLNVTAPAGGALVASAFPGGQAAGPHVNGGAGALVELVAPGSTVTVTQTALTVGASVLFAEIWAA